MREGTASFRESDVPLISWGHTPHNPLIEARVRAEARRIHEINRRILCKVILDEIHGNGRRAATCTAEVVLVRPKGPPIVSRHESPPGPCSQRLAHTITRAFRKARRRLLSSRSKGALSRRARHPLPDRDVSKGR
jgi:hypothetical protein